MEADGQIERIENYLTGRMSPEEKVEFESMLKSDPELNALFLRHKYFLDGVQGMKINALSSRLSQIRSTPVRRRTYLRIMAYAASVLILASLVYLLAKPAFTISAMERLADKYYAPPLAELQRSEPGYDDQDYQNAMEAFNTKNWKRAREHFARIPNTHPGYEQAQYFLAHAFVGEKEYQSAHDVFERIGQLKGAYEQQAQWNTVLTEMYLIYPKEDIEDKLKKIKNGESHFYRDKAAELLDELR